MVGGQAIDLSAVGSQRHRASAPSAAPLDPGRLQGMHTRKTGALIRASVSAGAVMAGADDRLIAALDRYATEIGLAFQIVDDILDVEGAASTLGGGRQGPSRRQAHVSGVLRLGQAKALATGCHTRAREALESAGLLDSRLDDIAGWIVNRTS